MSDASTIAVPELERIAALGWQPTSSEWLGGWHLRAAGGFTGRANSVLVLGAPGLDSERARQRVAGFYADDGLRPAYQIAPGTPDDAATRADAELSALGWPASPPALVMTAALTDLRYAVHGPEPVITVTDRPSQGWLDGYRYRGASLPPAARAVLENADRPGFAMAMDGANRLGVARGAVTGDWLGITAVTVEPQVRRRGLGTRLLAALARWGADLGARYCYLQVEADNAAAIALYARAGLQVHHRYWYRRPADAR